MSVTPDDVKRIFLLATEQATVAEQNELLDRLCGGNVELRRRVERLLAAHNGPDDFLDHPVVPIASEDDADSLAFLTPSPSPGALGRLGHYEIRRVVGRGGMGIVLLGFDENLHRVVAIKALTPSLATTGAARQRFVREARAAAAVSHDNVIAIHAVESAGPVPYIVMQYVDGRTLQEKLDQEGPLPVVDILRIGLQIADGLSAAHRQGLIHRDIKPSNILLENGVERVKITDFGLARAADDASVTKSGFVSGTPMYMSPEQAQGDRIDHRTDLFSLGSVLYAACVGHPPFRASTTMGVINRVCNESPRPISEIAPLVPAALVRLIERLMSKKVDGRINDAEAVADALRMQLAYLQGQGPAPIIPAIQSARPERKRKALRLAIQGALFAVALLAGLGLSRYLRPARSTEHETISVSMPPQLPSAKELASLHAPADALDPEKLTQEQRAAAGFGDPERAPKELVALLGEDHHRTGNHSCAIYSLAISPDGQTLAGGWPVRLWDLTTGKARVTLPGLEVPASAYAMQFTPDGEKLVIGSHVAGVTIYSAKDGRDLRILPIDGPGIASLRISPDGQTLAVGVIDGRVQMWDLATYTKRFERKTGVSPVWSVDFSPDGQTLAIGTDNVVSFWNVQDGSLARSSLNETGYVRVLNYHPSGRSVVTTGSYLTGVPPRLTHWDLTNNQEVNRLEGHSSNSLVAVWRADGGILATGGALDGEVRLWDMSHNPPSCQAITAAPNNREWLTSIAFTPEGRHLVVGSPTGLISVFRLARRGQIFTVGN